MTWHETLHKTLGRSKSNYRAWLAFQFIFATIFGAMSLMMPYINSFEDETTSIQSATTQGRWQIAISSVATMLIVALFPAALSYGLSRLMGINGTKDFKSNRALQMAITVWITIVFLCVIGGLAFWQGLTPFNLLGN